MTGRTPSFVVVLAGLAIFGLGLAAASSVLPEWRVAEVPEPELYEERLAEVAATLGLELTGPARTYPIAGWAVQVPEISPYQLLGAGAADALVDEHRAIFVSHRAEVEHSREGSFDLSVSFDLAGRAWNVVLNRPLGLSSFSPASLAGVPLDPLPAVLEPGMALAEDGAEEVFEAGFGTTRWTVSELTGTERPQILFQMDGEAPVRGAVRELGTVETYSTHDRGDYAVRFVGILGVVVLLCLVAVAIAFALALRRRIDLLDGALVAVALVVLSAALLWGESLRYFFWSFLGFALAANVLFVFLAWAAGESWLRDLGSDAAAAFDALRAGRIGRRVGLAAAWGLGAGTATAGANLAVHALVVATGWTVPLTPSLWLTPFRPVLLPLHMAAGQAAMLLLVWAVATFTLSERLARWRLPTVAALAALLGSLVLPVFASWPWAFGTEMVAYGLLSLAFLRGGSLGLAAGALTAQLAPIAAFGLQLPGWMAPDLAIATACLALFGWIAVVGARRSVDYVEEVAAPEFVRRLRDERRRAFEMDLLSRMQVGLLPGEPPKVAGWEVAASSMLAHEVGGDFYDFFDDSAGRLWVAAGDVAGHGAFCSIGHAMTKAALASLIEGDATPAQVLAEVDRVLRTLDTRRLFTALALLRLDPSTGEALYANAGYPYPLLRDPRGAGGAAPEDALPGPSVVEVELPGLPLGDGPARTYRDRSFTVPAGGALVFSSDGLFEALGRGERPYGFERPRSVLARVDDSSAEGIRDALMADWRRFVGPGALRDDTTVVVLVRAADTRAAA